MTEPQGEKAFTPRDLPGEVVSALASVALLLRRGKPQMALTLVEAASAKVPGLFELQRRWGVVEGKCELQAERVAEVEAKLDRVLAEKRRLEEALARSEEAVERERAGIRADEEARNSRHYRRLLNEFVRKAEVADHHCLMLGHDQLLFDRIVRDNRPDEVDFLAQVAARWVREPADPWLDHIRKRVARYVLGLTRRRLGHDRTNAAS